MMHGQKNIKVKWYLEWVELPPS